MYTAYYTSSQKAQRRCISPLPTTHRIYPFSRTLQACHRKHVTSLSYTAASAVFKRKWLRLHHNNPQHNSKIQAQFANIPLPLLRLLNGITIGTVQSLQPTSRDTRRHRVSPTPAIPYTHIWHTRGRWTALLSPLAPLPLSSTTHCISILGPRTWVCLAALSLRFALIAISITISVSIPIYSSFPFINTNILPADPATAQDSTSFTQLQTPTMETSRKCP